MSFRIIDIFPPHHAFPKMNREHNFAWSRDQLSKLFWDVKSERTFFHIWKNVFWHHILYWEWVEDDWPEICQNSYGAIDPPVVWSTDLRGPKRGSGNWPFFCSFRSSSVCVECKFLEGVSHSEGGGGPEYRRGSRPKWPKSPIYAVATCILGEPRSGCNKAYSGLDYTEKPGARPGLRMGFSGPTTVQTRGLVCSSKSKWVGFHFLEWNWYWAKSILIVKATLGSLVYFQSTSWYE